MNFLKQLCKNFIFIPIQIMSPIVYCAVLGISYDYIDFIFISISILLCIGLLLCFESFLIKIFISAFFTGVIYGAVIMYALVFVCRFQENCL